MLIGYVRHVPKGVDETDQIKLMSERSIGKFFTEQTGSRSSELRARQDMLAFAREGDSVIVQSIRVIARSLPELMDVLHQLETQNVTFIAIDEDVDTSSDTGKFLMKVLNSMATLDTDSLVAQNREESAKELAEQAAQEARKGGAQPQGPQSKILTPPPQKPEDAEARADPAAGAKAQD